MDKIKALLTALAVGAVIAVILILQGFENGLYRQLYNTATALQTDLIVTQAGVSNLLGGRSALPQLTREEVESIPGVKIAHPLTTIPAIYEKQLHKMPIFIFVYDTKGGPTEFLAGHPVSDGRDIVIDESLAKRHGLEVGDDFILSAFTFHIAGITRHRTALFMPFAYISYDGMIDLFLESELAPDLSTFPLLSFLLVELTSGTNPDRVLTAIENQVDTVDVFTTKTVAQNAMTFGQDLFGPVMRLLVSIAYVIGFLVVGLIMEADIRSKRRNFGVLKAIGFSLGAIFISIVQQAVLILLISFPIGLILASLLSFMIEAWLPLYSIYFFEPNTLLKTFGASTLFAMAGSLIPLHFIRRVDPIVAMQGE